MALLFATGNPHKVEQVAASLDRPVIQTTIDLPEIQAVDVRDVIEEKTRAAFGMVKQPVLVEDTSLAFHAWNGLPGALIKWFLDGVGNEGLCKMLSTYEDRRATAETCIGCFDGRAFIVFTGSVEGQITMHPRGERGFGWDPIFQPSGSEKTFAEMSAEEAAPFNMRKLAALQLKTYLNSPDR